ncbi:MAG: metalloregulator ArsR/SmtB family transcription factor, partial [Fimbriimonadales bacterium]
MANSAINTDQDLQTLARAFAALGHPTRLALFRFLLAQDDPLALGPEGGVRPVVGATVGELCCHVSGAQRVTPNLSRHIRLLAEAGLIETERMGRHIVCRAVPSAVALLRLALEP